MCVHIDMCTYVYDIRKRTYIHYMIYTYIQMTYTYMVGCQNDGLLLGPLNTRCRIILRTQEGTIIWTTTHIHRKNNYLAQLIGGTCRSLLKAELRGCCRGLLHLLRVRGLATGSTGAC